MQNSNFTVGSNHSDHEMSDISQSTIHQKYDRKTFVYDSSKKTKLCAYKLCPILHNYAEKHFKWCTGFDSIEVDGTKVYKY